MKNFNHLQSECQHQTQHNKQQNESKQHQDRQPRFKRQRQQQREQQNQLPLRNFYQPLTPLIEESDIVERPIVPGNTSYAGVLRKEKKCYRAWRCYCVSLVE